MRGWWGPGHRGAEWASQHCKTAPEDSQARGLCHLRAKSRVGWGRHHLVRPFGTSPALGGLASPDSEDKGKEPGPCRELLGLLERMRHTPLYECVLS